MSSQLKKITEAEKLSISSKTDGIEKLTESIKLYKQLCMDPVIGIDDKVATVLSMIKHIPGEAEEMITRWRDMIPFVYGKHYDSLVSLLVKLSKNSSVNAHERTMIAVALYNHAMLDVCFRCFETIAMDSKVPVDYRIEACRYLYGTDETEHKEISQECLMEILENFSLSSIFRYKIIAGFISHKGVISYLNTSKIKVPYDEEFVYGLQMAFFQETKNGTRERILSGQHLLQMDCVSAEEKAYVGNAIMNIALDTSLDENTRADAADVMMRLGDTKQSREARQITINMGHSAVNVKNENFLDRVKTLYNNSQNMHDESISLVLDKFIEKMLNEDVRLVPFEEAQKEVSNLVRSKNMERSKNFLAYKALNRISIDTATFSSKKVTLAEIFIHVWLRIKKYSGDTRKMLEDRIVEELIDMGDTCSTGHSGRFINVLSKVDPELNIVITFEAQIIANVAGRLNAKIRDIEDVDLKSSISMGMFPDASEEDINVYKKFIETTLKVIFEEMKEEFVGGKYLSDNEFDEYFEKASKEWKH